MGLKYMYTYKHIKVSHRVCYKCNQQTNNTLLDNLSSQGHVISCTGTVGDTFKFQNNND